MGSGQPLLVSWTYISRSLLVPTLADEQLDEIASRAHARNRELGITGALIFTGTRFAQEIEGPSDAVEEVKTLILSDTRHTDIVVVDSGRRGTRFFEGWSLALVGTSAHYVSQIVERPLKEKGEYPREGLEALRRLMSEFTQQARRSGGALPRLSL